LAGTLFFDDTAGPEELAPGLILHRRFFQPEAQASLLEAIRAVVREAPLFTPTMPKTGKPFSVRMTNCGALGWVSDRGGYRYQPGHPVTDRPWPAVPAMLLDAWRAHAAWPVEPEACLVNWYDPSARMGLHQDRDEQDLVAPVLSVSLGDTCVFRFGGTDRKAPTRSVKLASGDLLIIGGVSRLCFHGVDRILPGTSDLLPNGGRINLTLRRVSASG
jgi:DNA oxidative demethylase